MLKELSIRNFAIIDDLRIRFSGGLTIMSGETGAGKSIILNAVNLLLGSRASAELVRSGEDAAELEAFFEIGSGSKTALAMQTSGFETGDGLLIRRRISLKDGNRVYINDRLSTSQALIAITDNLASISGQHAHQGLLKPEQHLSILDQFAGLTRRRDRVGQLFRQLTALIKTHDRLIRTRQRQTEQIELLRFQENEITSAALAPGEDEQLETERRRLKHAEELYAAAYETIERLHGQDRAVNAELAEIHHRLEKSAGIDPALQAPASQLADIRYGLEDLVGELQRYMKTVQVDPGRLEGVEERLDTLVKLKRKYGGTIESVLETLASIQTDLAEVENIGDRIAETESALTATREELVGEATALSAARQKAAKKLSKRVEKELASLRMAETAFAVESVTIAADAHADPRQVDSGRLLTESGWDRAEFMIAPNVGEALKPLAAIASGGELSRVVLALKCILAASDAVETLVFDEVDAGIGGGTAEVVGRKLRELARYHQVICITHLPQIARFAEQHLKITKAVLAGRTRTEIRKLGKDDRQKEIARMLGGETITKATLAHARELLENESSRGR
jgi:DNA repair protein RecN (Recombination protein N)